MNTSRYHLMFLIAIITNLTEVVTSLPKYAPTKRTGFVARLIHRSSPLSPYYDPTKTIDDIVAENRLISAARHESRLHANHEITKPAVRLSYTMPTVSRDFVMLYHVGTPPVEQLGIPDTGSDLIWLQCGPCVVCYHQESALFNATGSSTYESIPCMSSDCHSSTGTCAEDNYHCSYNQIYVRGVPSSFGILAKETFTFGYLEDYDDVPIIENFIFGCGKLNINPGNLVVSGVVGLGNYSVSLVGQLGGLKMFSYCHDEESSGGLIRFGYTAKMLGEGKTPLVPNSFGSYHLILEGIDVGDEKVDVSSDVFKMKDDAGVETGVIIDSGTSVTELISVAFDAVVKTFKLVLPDYESITMENWELCYGDQGYGPVGYDTLPEITFRFKDLPIRFPRKNMWIWDMKKENVCLAMGKLNNTFSIIGMQQQTSFNVAYDLEENYLWMSHQEYCPQK